MKTIKYKKINDSAIVPKQATKGSACFDLCTCNGFCINNGEFYKVHTGLVFEIPKGYSVEILPRSGFASKGIIIPNSPGIIDSDYRGEILVMFYGLFIKELMFFKTGDRIAQARLVRNEDIGFCEEVVLSDTERGFGGFGSTGR